MAGNEDCCVEPIGDSAEWWDARYLGGHIPWDTGVVPPEVEALLASGLPVPGWALDLGCGSGLSSRYLAGRGFRVVGVDLAQSALVRGWLRAQSDGVPAWFCRGDVSSLSFLRVRATLALDIGCLHAIPRERRSIYIASLAEHMASGAYYLLYAFRPSPVPPALSSAGDACGSSVVAGPLGVGPLDIAEFAPRFRLLWVQHGSDRNSRSSAWYLMQRV